MRRTIITLEHGTVVVPQSYEDVRAQLERAYASRSPLVELQVDWGKPLSGHDARPSLLGLRHIRAVRSWPEE